MFILSFQNKLLISKYLITYLKSKEFFLKKKKKFPPNTLRTRMQVGHARDFEVFVLLSLYLSSDDIAYFLVKMSTEYMIFTKLSSI